MYSNNQNYQPNRPPPSQYPDPYGAGGQPQYPQSAYAQPAYSSHPQYQQQYQQPPYPAGNAPVPFPQPQGPPQAPYGAPYSQASPSPATYSYTTPYSAPPPVAQPGSEKAGYQQYGGATGYNPYQAPMGGPEPPPPMYQPADLNPMSNPGAVSSPAMAIDSSNAALNSPEPVKYILPPAKPPQMNATPEYKDVWATVLYVICSLAYIYAIYRGFPAFLSNNSFAPSNFYSNNSGPATLIAAIYPILVFIASSTLLGLLWFLLMQSYPRQMIKLSYWSWCGLAIVAGVLFLIGGSIAPGVIFIVFGLLYAWAYVAIRSKIPFASVMLELAASITRQFPAMIFSGFVGMIISIIYQIVWFITLYGLIILILQNYPPINQPDGTQVMNPHATGYMIASFVTLLFMLFWTHEIIKNTIHVTCAGLYATVYFTGTQEGDSLRFIVPVTNPTAKAARRALTTSFGSICFGSLLIAILDLLRYLARSSKSGAARDGNFMLMLICCCLECLLTCIRDILEYFNLYAFTQVAMYGKDYCDAGKSTMALIKDRGLQAVINDNLIHNVITIGGVIVGLIGAALGFLIIYLDGNDFAYNSSTIATYCVLGFVVNINCFYVMMSVIISGVATTFVCIAEDPGTMQRLKPELFERMAESWPGINWGIHQPVSM